jgi:hypothetical protein
MIKYRGLGDDHIGFSEIDIGKLDKLFVCEKQLPSSHSKEWE